MKAVLICFLLYHASATAATYYIAPSGGSDANAGTEALPWATWTKVRNTIVTGDTVISRGGVYSGQQWWSGTGGASNLTIQAYPGEVPIIANYSNSAAGTALFINAGYNFSLIKGFTFSNNYNPVNVQNTVGLTFDECRFGWFPTADGYPWGHGTYACVSVWSTYFTTFTNCFFYGWGVNEAGEDHGAPLQIGGFNDLYDTNGWGTTVVDCRFVYGGHDNMEIYTYSNIIRRCVFYNPRSMLFPDDGVPYGNRNIGLLGGNSRRNLFEENLFAATGRPVDDDEVTALELSSPFHIVRRNRFFNLAGPAISPYAKGFGVGPSNIYAYHNTTVMAAMDSTLVANDLSAIRAPHADAISNRWVNSAFYWIGETNTEGVYDFWSAGGNQARFAGNYDNTGNPLLANTNWGGVEVTLPLDIAADYTLPNLRPTATSPLINSAVWLTTITSANGSGTELVLHDPGYFKNSWSIPGELGDLIQLEGQSSTARITAIDYDTGAITVDASLTWTNGQGVALPYAGSAPDIGAYEYTNAPAPAITIGSGVTLGNGITLR